MITHNIKTARRQLIWINMSLYFILFCLFSIGILISTGDASLASKKNMALTEISCLVQNRGIFKIEEYKTSVWKVGLYLSPNLLLDEKFEDILNFPINGSIDANMYPSWSIIGTFGEEEEAIEELKKYRSGSIINCYMEMNNSKIEIMAKRYQINPFSMIVFLISLAGMIFSFYCLEKNFTLLYSREN